MRQVLLLATLLMRVIFTALAAFCAGAPETAYEALDSLLAGAPAGNWYSFLADGDFTGMKIVGYCLGALVLVMTYAQERIAYREALRGRTESLFWLDELRKGSSDRLGSVLRAKNAEDRRMEMRNYRKFCLEAAAQAWGGEENRNGVRVGYYLPGQPSDGGKGRELDLRAAEPLDGLPEQLVHSTPPEDYSVHAGRLGKYWSGLDGLPSIPAKGFPGKSVMQVPVRSPLEATGKASGWVVADSRSRRSFRGQSTKIGASFLATMLATGELLGRGQ